MSFCLCLAAKKVNNFYPITFAKFSASPKCHASNFLVGELDPGLHGVRPGHKKYGFSQIFLPPGKELPYHYRNTIKRQNNIGSIILNFGPQPKNWAGVTSLATKMLDFGPFLS